jgi:hypothetical protein
MTTKTKNLFQRLLDIMEEAGTMKKAGYNDFNKYSYIKESDVAEKFQTLLVKHGVFLFSSVTEAKSVQVQSASGKPSILSTVQMQYTFVNVDNPEDKFSVNAAGDGMDTGDKAIYKALTGAHKYVLIRNFNLGSEDDAETASPEIGGYRVGQGQAEPIKSSNDLF